MGTVSLLYMFDCFFQEALATSTPVMAMEATTHTLKLTGGATRVPPPISLIPFP